MTFLEALPLVALGMLFIGRVLSLEERVTALEAINRGEIR